MVGDAESHVPAPAEVRAALARVLASESFANSPRLQAFLTYVVEEDLSGRGTAIRGKIVATDVYGKQLDENGSALNLVRVEARRLRRALDDYYSEDGRADTVKIGMQTGGYRPRFERIVPGGPTEPPAPIDLSAPERGPTPPPLHRQSLPDTERACPAVWRLWSAASPS